MLAKRIDAEDRMDAGAKSRINRACVRLRVRVCAHVGARLRVGVRAGGPMCARASGHGGNSESHPV